MLQKLKRYRELKSMHVHIDHIGDVLIEQSRKAKRLSISIRPFKGVRVAVPLGISLKTAEHFLYDKTAWIQKHLSRIKVLEHEHHKRIKSTQSVNRKKAKEILIQRLEQLSNQSGLKYNKVFIRNQKTRWGSCSAKNNINLNMNLIRLPKRLIDYTILHELVHTRVKNHGCQFWQELDRHIKDAKKLDKELNRYIIGNIDSIPATHI